MKTSVWVTYLHQIICFITTRFVFLNLIFYEGTISNHCSLPKTCCYGMHRVPSKVPEHSNCPKKLKPLQLMSVFPSTEEFMQYNMLGDFNLDFLIILFCTPSKHC